MPKYDPAYEETEKLLSEMEKKIAKEYKKASKEVESKLDDYMQKFKSKDEQWQKWVAEGKKSEDAYKAWRLQQIAVGKRWESMKNTLAQEYVDTDKIAKSIVNGYKPEVYAVNFNYGTYEVEVGSNVDTGFTLYNRQTVERIMRDDPELLPSPGEETSKKIAEGKAVRWNKKQIQSVMVQGILQGESIPKLAKRLAREVGEKDYKAAVRNARTMTTGAQNAGRVDSFKRAKEMGIDMEVEWRAVLDGRTRHEHRQLDGQRRPVGEPFEVGKIKIEYAGDPNAPGSMIYNCRCTLRGIVAGLEPMARKYRSTEAIGDMTYEEWKNAKAPKKKSAKETESKIVNGSDISGTWKRREDKFDFAIDDIVNAQGFDGLPRVVNSVEFNDAVKESGLIFARGYTAPTEETLKDYHEQLTSGKWYIDCSHGGAVHGQGMYTAGNYGTTLSDKTLNTMQAYSQGIGKVETMTLVKDAKIISKDDLYEKKESLKYQYAKDLINRELTEDEDLVLRAMTIPSSLSISEAVEAFGKNPEVSKAMADEWSKVSKDVINEIGKLPTDQGQLAALLGYDAIEVSLNSQGDKYFVILNRTKVILKGD